MRLINQPDKGMKFWGCIKYPNCRGTIDFEQWEKDRKSEGKGKPTLKPGAGGSMSNPPEAPPSASGPHGSDGPPPPPYDLQGKTIIEMKNELRAWFNKNPNLHQIPPDYWNDDDVIPHFYHRFQKHGTRQWNRWVDDFRK